MLYEVRHYDIILERMDEYLAWLEVKASPILFDQFRFRLIGFWRGIAKAGEPEPKTNLFWILAWESDEERRERWAAVFASPEWQAAWAEVIDPANGKSSYHLQTSSTLLRPLPISPLQ